MEEEKEGGSDEKDGKDERERERKREREGRSGWRKKKRDDGGRSNSVLSTHSFNSKLKILFSSSSFFVLSKARPGYSC